MLIHGNESIYYYEHICKQRYVYIKDGPNLQHLAAQHSVIIAVNQGFFEEKRRDKAMGLTTQNIGCHSEKKHVRDTERDPKSARLGRVVLLLKVLIS